ncbi:MAG TPA: uroporphyrinogen decarboxylase [Alphaproteobacteria bacterium]
MNTPIIIDAWKGKKTDKTPIWLMRQAGRYLPEYREIRAKAGSFLDLCFNPALAAEVTMQPVHRFDVDAAILFSDILVIPFALDQKLTFVENEGPKLQPISDAQSLVFNDFESCLAPILETVANVRAALPKDKALLGFAGSPWTVASYMIEGGGGHDFSKIKAMAHVDLQHILDVVVDATIRYTVAQIEAGADAIQLFESWAGVLSDDDFDDLVIKPNQTIVAALKKQYPDVPVIGFPRTDKVEDVRRFSSQTGVDAVGLSQDIPFKLGQDLQRLVCVQGNLAPELLLQGGDAMVRKSQEICDAWGDGPFVFNLGHGVIKETNPDYVAQLVETVHGSKP